MSNFLGAYNPTFYAQEALIWLEKSLGMATRVHRGFDKSPQQQGSLITIRRPATFTVQDAPGTAQDVVTEQVQIELSRWKEVKFQLTDKELAYTGSQIVAEHIAPAAHALASYIDADLLDLYKDIPSFTGTAGTPLSQVTDITNARKALFDQRVPMQDPSKLHMVVNGDAESNFLALPAFSQYQGAGDYGAQTQMNGSLGRKFGLELSANSQVPTHTKGTANVTATALVGAHTKGATTVGIDAVLLTGTLVPGDSFVIAGNSQRYAVTNTVTAAGNAMGGIQITPALVQDYADNSVVTLTLQNGARNMAFHRDAFALAMAPLSEMGNGVGAHISTIQDPNTGLSLRSRIFYVGNSSTIVVALDVLYGVKTLNPQLAVNVLG